MPSTSKGTSLPDETVQASLAADAVLLGAVGGPKWDVPTAPDRPERGLLAIRKALNLFANLRPVKLSRQLIASSTIKESVLEGVDMLVIRELTGGAYFGPRKEAGDEAYEAYDTMLYTRPEIERVVRVAAEAARGRRKQLTSVDKANVLASSRLWRRVATEVMQDYPDVQVEHVLVDAMAMHLIRQPAAFDVIVAENLFGDILTDEASMLAGSMGMLPSASLGDKRNSHGLPLGLYEPIHGSAPDIAGRGIANPLATILSVAMLLRHSLGLEAEAQADRSARSTPCSIKVCAPATSPTPAAKSWAPSSWATWSQRKYERRTAKRRTAAAAAQRQYSPARRPAGRNDHRAGRPRDLCTWRRRSAAWPRRGASGDAAAGDQIRAMIPDLVDDLPKALAVLKAFTTYFQLVNLAEDEQRTQVLRRRTADAQTTGVPGRETIAEAVGRLKQEGVTADEMRAILGSLFIRPVLTAHPTETKRQAILDQAAHDCGDAAASQHRRPAAAWKPAS